MKYKPGNQITPVAFVPQTNGKNEVAWVQFHTIKLTILKVFADHLENGIPDPAVITVTFLDSPETKQDAWKPCRTLYIADWPKLYIYKPISMEWWKKT